MTNVVLIVWLAAFAQVESSNRNLPPYPDGATRAFGYYGFHADRWAECGGRAETWGCATKAEQDAVMVNAISRALRRKPQGSDALRWVATTHNAGHGINQETPYVARLRRALNTQGTKP